MKFKSIALLMTFGFALALDASANSTTCSNADRSLAYSHVTGNGGAPLDLTTLTYRGVTVSSSRPFDAHVDFALSDARPIESTSPAPGTTRDTFVAKATGAVQIDDQTVSFNQWVVCEETRMPICRLCP